MDIMHIILEYTGIMLHMGITNTIQLQEIGSTLHTVFTVHTDIMCGDMKIMYATAVSVSKCISLM